MRGIEYLPSEFYFRIPPFPIEIGFGQLNETVPFGIEEVAIEMVRVLVDPQVEDRIG